MKKPESEEVEKTQKPATGEHENAQHALNADDEAKAHGTTPKKVGGHGQGGAQH